MKRKLGVVAVLLSAVLLMGAADGSWLKRVSPSDHGRTSPLVGSANEQQKAAAAGAQLFHSECAKCHGDDGMGRGSRPPVASARIAGTTDGELFWLMTNGNPWKGMPPWSMLPPKQRWQLVAYLRALNPPGEASPAAPTVSPQAAPAAPGSMTPPNKGDVR